MIPKIIHYCWFGRNPKPKDVLDYIDTWKKYNPDYEIKEWNEDNFDINCCKYVREAYNVKKFAFVSDYARLFALYKEGGIYLDTEVEVRKNFDALLYNKSFIGWEDLAPGTACIGVEKNEKWIIDVMSTYTRESFIKWYGKLNEWPNPYRIMEVLKKYGLDSNKNYCELDNGLVIYPIDYFCAHHWHGEYVITTNTYCIHHYSESWIKSQNIFEKIKQIIYNIYTKIILQRNGIV